MKNIGESLTQEVDKIYRIAIMIIGEKRSFENIKNEIENNLILNLEHQNAIVDVFINTNLDISINNLISINKFNNFDKLSSIINHQIYRCYICYEEIKLYMKNNNINYDFFIKIRPDLRIFKNGIPPIISWDTNKINVRMRVYPEYLNMLCVPNFYAQGPATVDDQIFIVPKDIADKAFLIDKGNYKEICNCGWNEGKLTRIWESHNIKFKITPINAIINNWKYDKNKEKLNRCLEFEKKSSNS
jgi:hypothetical protein